MDADEVRRGMRVVFWPDFRSESLMGKVKGVADPMFPHMFLIKADNGRTYEVNADSILMRLP